MSEPRELPPSGAVRSRARARTRAVVQWTVFPLAGAYLALYLNFAESPQAYQFIRFEHFWEFKVFFLSLIIGIIWSHAISLVTDLRQQGPRAALGLVGPLLLAGITFGAAWKQGQANLNRKVFIEIAGNGDGQYGCAHDLQQDGLSEREIAAYQQRLLDDISSDRVRFRIGLDYSGDLERAQHYSGCNVTSVLELIEARHGNGEFADLYELDLPWIPYFVERGWIVPIDGLLAEKGVPGIHAYGVTGEVGLFPPPDNGEAAGMSGTLRTYVTPFYINVGMLMYRVDVFARQFPGDPEPRTWNELMRKVAAIQTKEPGRWSGFACQLDNYEGLICNYIEILWAMGGEIPVGTATDGTKLPVVDTEAGARALHWLKQQIEEGTIPREALSWNEAATTEHFGRGEALVMRNWPGAFAEIQQSESYSNLRGKVDVLLRPLPFTGVSRGSAKMCLGGWYYAVSRRALEEGRARDAVEGILHLTDEEQYRLMASPHQYLHVRQEAAYARIPASEKVLEQFMGDHDALFYAQHYFKNRFYRNRPVLPEYPIFSTLFADALHRYLSDRSQQSTIARARETLRQAERKIHAAILKHRAESRDPTRGVGSRKSEALQ